jgi:hypothetical protein
LPEGLQDAGHFRHRQPLCFHGGSR